MTVQRWRCYLVWGNPLVGKLSSPLTPEEVSMLQEQGYSYTIVGAPMDKHIVLLRPGEDGERDLAVVQGRRNP